MFQRRRGEGSAEETHGRRQERYDWCTVKSFYFVGMEFRALTHEFMDFQIKHTTIK